MYEETEYAIWAIENWFGFRLYPSQQKIADFFFNDKKKATIKACTRYGKSQTIALCAIMYAIINNNKRVGIIAPTNDKTKIIMGYVLNALASCDKMNNIVDLDLMQLTKLERLKREISKHKVTFKNGSSIEVLTADVKGKGFATMGWAFDLNIIDETAEIPDEVFAKIYRMLVESPTAKLIEIGNPWNLNHFFEHHNLPDWEKYTIDWKTAVKEGRLTEEAIEDQRNNLPELAFRVLYDAEFPEDADKCAMPKEYIDKAGRTKEVKDYDSINIGVDVARGGTDYSVITVVGYKDAEVFFIESKTIDKRDIMVVVGEARVIADKYKNTTIMVDVVGLGSGVYDRLKELNYNVREFISNSVPRSSRYHNYKTESFFVLRELFGNDKFYNLLDSKYKLELRKYTLDMSSEKSIKLVDPEDKSPDYGDSLIMAVSIPRQIRLGVLNI